jgi:hypothetical protein
MKSQLTDWKLDRMKNFGFASILCSFFFERVLYLSPKVEITPHGLHNPTMSRWTEVMRRLGGGKFPMPYNDEFFHWWCRQVIAIDDYPYGGIDYQGHHDMPLPLGYSFGEISEK